MPWKKNEDGSLAFDEKTGNPVYVTTDGKDMVYDPDEKARQIAELTAKAQKRKAELEEAQKRLSVLDGIEDVPSFIEQARKDRESLENMKGEEKDREAQTLQRIQKAVQEAVQPKMADIEKLKASVAEYQSAVSRMKIDNAFTQSEYVAKELVSPALAQKLFAECFGFSDEGQLVGKTEDGTPIISPATGKVASFDEALAVLVEKSPFRASVMKPAPGGSGSSPSAGGGSGSIARADFDALPPAKRVELMRKGYKIV